MLIRENKVNKIPITVSGEKKLRDELKSLKTKDRQEVIEAIATAREHGDLKENAEYHAARERQSFIEGRIKDIESTLSNAEIIDLTNINANGKVIFGSTVTVCDVETTHEISYKIVGDDEANIKQNLISYTSPIAKALIGKESGEVVIVKAPAGDRQFEIVDIKYLQD